MSRSCGSQTRAPQIWDNKADEFRFAIRVGIEYVPGMTEAQRKRLKRIMKDALRIQDRFAAEPVLARTGKGYLRSEGVETLRRIKAGLRKSHAH